MPKDGTATRNRILDAAEHLVIEQGYAATSVDQVIAASASSKGAFFHHFDSKLDLARALVDRYVAADLAHLDDALARTSAIEDPAHRALEFVRLFEDAGAGLMDVQSGCLYLPVLSERELLVDPASEAVRRAVVTWREGYAGILRAALASRDDADELADELADHLFVTFEGAFMLCRSLDDDTHMSRQLRSYRLMLEALLAKG